jgi:hypothetical protein
MREGFATGQFGFATAKSLGPSKPEVGAASLCANGKKKCRRCQDRQAETAG